MNNKFISMSELDDIANSFVEDVRSSREKNAPEETSAPATEASTPPPLQPLEHALLRQYTISVKENAELEQRLHRLMDYNKKLARELREMKKGNNKDATKQIKKSLDNKLSAENEYLKTYVSAVNDFMERNKLYVSKKSLCLYKRERTPVGSVFCLECPACLQAIDGRGVVCLHSLKDMKVSIDEE